MPNLSEFPTKEEADVFAESTAASFRNAGMIVVYDPD
jgi:hypothetical protein